jgi:hypothetical protein
VSRTYGKLRHSSRCQALLSVALIGIILVHILCMTPENLNACTAPVSELQKLCFTVGRLALLALGGIY